MDNTEVLKIGPGALSRVGETLSAGRVGGKLLYVSDPVVDGLYGREVRAQLKDIGAVKQEYVGSNTIAYAMSVAERVIATDINCIVAMGGGRVLDVCKYAAYIGKIPLLSIATTAANDGIASPIAVLKRRDGKPKSLGCAVPSMLIVDTEVIQRGPIELIKAGIGDTLSNYTALLDWELAVERGRDSMNGYAYLMSRTSLDVLMKTQYGEVGPGLIEVLANSLVLSGIAMKFAGTSRPVSGSEHLFSHALDYFSDSQNLHGIQVALGAVATLLLIGRDPSPLMDYLGRFRVDIDPRSLGIDEPTFVYCMQHAAEMRQNRYTHLDEADLSEGNLRRVYRRLTA